MNKRIAGALLVAGGFFLYSSTVMALPLPEGSNSGAGITNILNDIAVDGTNDG